MQNPQRPHKQKRIDPLGSVEGERLAELEALRNAPPLTAQEMRWTKDRAITELAALARNPSTNEDIRRDASGFILLLVGATGEFTDSRGFTFLDPRRYEGLYGRPDSN